MGGISTVILVSALAQVGGFSFSGPTGEVETTSERAFIATGADPTVDAFTDARGAAELTLQDRVKVPSATYGDEARFRAQLRVGLDEYRISLTQVGADPKARSMFGHPLGGGVAVDTRIFGQTGIGPPRQAPARAAFAVFGYARVVRNGLLVAERAPIQIFALATGIHADDDTHRRLREGRPRDLELVVYVPHIGSDLVPGNYLLATFEDVAIRLEGNALRAETNVRVEQPGIVSIAPSRQNVPPPLFEGFADSPETADGVPLVATPFPGTPQPLNADPALPFPDAVDPLATPTTTDTVSVGATQEALPLLDGVDPLNATGAAPPTGTTATPAPLNAQPALPFPQGVTPLNTVPDLVGTGVQGPLPAGAAPVPAAPSGSAPAAPTTPAG